MMKKIIVAIGQFSEDAKTLIFLSAVLLAITIYLGPDHAVAFRYDVLRAFCSILFIVACIIYIGEINKKWIKLLLMSPIVIVLSIQIGYRFYFGERISMAVLNSVVETNKTEAIGILKSAWPAILVSSLSIVFFNLYFLKIPKIKKSKNKNGILGLTVLTFFLPVVAEVIESDRFVPDALIYPPAIGSIYYYNNNMVFGDLIYVSSVILLKQNQVIGEKFLNKNIILGGNGIENVILVIGESSVANRYGVYGYHINTSPQIANLTKENDFCVVKNVHSVASITRDAVSMLLSFQTPENEEPLFKEKSLVELAKDNGYATYWLSSQPLEGRYETRFSHIAKESDVIELTNWDDDALIEIFKKNVLKNREQKKFIVMQMNGSHVPYGNKYDVEDKIALPQGDDYDRSIHKTDRLLSLAMNLLSKENEHFLFVYLSDHGEIVGKGHGFTYGGDLQFRIPMIIKYRGAKFAACDFMESLRSEAGDINALNSKYLIVKSLGYEVNRHYLRAEINNDRVLLPDGRVEAWKNVKNTSIQ